MEKSLRVRKCFWQLGRKPFGFSILWGQRIAQALPSVNPSSGEACGLPWCESHHTANSSAISAGFQCKWHNSNVLCPRIPSQWGTWGKLPAKQGTILSYQGLDAGPGRLLDFQTAKKKKRKRKRGWWQRIWDKELRKGAYECIPESEARSSQSEKHRTVGVNTNKTELSCSRWQWGKESNVGRWRLLQISCCYSKMLTVYSTSFNCRSPPESSTQQQPTPTHAATDSTTLLASLTATASIVYWRTDWT